MGLHWIKINYVFNNCGERHSQSHRLKFFYLYRCVLHKNLGLIEFTYRERRKYWHSIVSTCLKESLAVFAVVEIEFADLLMVVKARKSDSKVKPNWHLLHCAADRKQSTIQGIIKLCLSDGVLSPFNRETFDLIRKLQFVDRQTCLDAHKLCHRSLSTRPRPHRKATSMRPLALLSRSSKWQLRSS